MKATIDCISTTVRSKPGDNNFCRFYYFSQKSTDLIRLQLSPNTCSPATLGFPECDMLSHLSMARESDEAEARDKKTSVAGAYLHEVSRACFVSHSALFGERGDIIASTRAWYALCGVGCLLIMSPTALCSVNAGISLRRRERGMPCVESVVCSQCLSQRSVR